MYCRLTPAVPGPCFSWPVSSSAPTVARLRRQRRTAASSPATACRLTWLIVAASSHDARFSNRWARSGDRSPACSAIDHPFRDGSSLASAFTYFPACSHVWTRAKHGRSASIRADLSRTARRAPILAAAAAFDSFVSTTHDRQAAALTSQESPQPRPSRQASVNWRLPYLAWADIRHPLLRRLRP